ncbi:MFS transporter [Neorhizobium sp. NCHU2750]|uniref:MFS transporter n=1 Tax=Neorhizobium sp. NCHU2750 TaxID=1825976 RepID=UPI000EB64728|nr:3-phenylpropionic acid transporter [Neorhizobium sp. NCHU2750]
MSTPATLPAAPAQFQFRCSLAYAAPLSLNGILVPYLPVWLVSCGFTPFQIAAVLAAQVVCRVAVATSTGTLAGMASEPYRILVWSSALSLLSVIGLFVTSNFWVVLAIVGIQAALFAPYAPMVEAIAISGVRRWGFLYGRMRVWGSIGFVVMTLVAGNLSSLIGTNAVPITALVVLVASLAVAFVAPRLGREIMVRPARSAAGPRGLPFRQVHLLLIGASLIQSSHGMFYGFSTIQWQGMGFSNGVIAGLWCIGVMAEICVFFVSGHIARRFSPWTLMRFGCFVGILRWSLFPVGGEAWFYAILQLGHAFSFAFVHLGLQYRLSEAVAEDRQASAQGAYVAYNGAFLALSTLLSGIIYRHLEIYGYYAMVVLALIGLAAITVASGRYPQRSASGE